MNESGLTQEVGWGRRGSGLPAYYTWTLRSMAGVTDLQGLSDPIPATTPSPGLKQTGAQ